MRSVPTHKHPYLLFTSEDLPAIRERASGLPASRFRHFLRADCESGFLKPESLVSEGRTPVYADRLQVIAITQYAFEGILSGDRRFTETAKQALLNLTRWTTLGTQFDMAQGGTIRDGAVAYDLLHPELSPEERTQAETFLAKGARFLYEGGKAGDLHWSGRNQGLANWRAQMYSGIGMAGLALWDSHPEAQEWVREAADVMKDIMDHDFDPEGASYEAYVRYVLGVYYHSLFPMLEALRRVTGEDLLGYSRAVLQRAMPFMAYMMYPALNGMPAIGDSDESIHSAGLFLARVAAEYGDGLAAYYLDALLKEKSYHGGGDGLWGTLWARPVTAENPEKSPRLCLAKAYNRDLDAPEMFGSGHVFLRTGFTRHDDMQFVCQAGEAGGFHGHADKGSYLLNAYGVRFLRDYFDGPYEGEEFRYRHSGEAHQTVLIDGEGQGAEVIGLTDPDYHTQVARVETLESLPGYDYVTMDTTKAYRHCPANRNLMWARRHVIFVRQAESTGYFVVIDDVQKDGSQHIYSHPFHYNDVDVSVDSAEGGRVVLANPQASLHIVAVYPQGFSATQHRMYGDAYVKLTCDKPCVRFVMATVLYPAKAGDALPAIDPIDAGDEIGVAVAGTRIAFERSTGRVLVDGGPRGGS